MKYLFFFILGFSLFLKAEVKPRLLYVEDDDMVREIGILSLSREFEVTAFETSDAAFTHFEKDQNFLVAVLDIDLDGSSFNGVELARKLKKIKPSLVVVLRASSLDQEGSSQELAIEAGVVGFILKNSPHDRVPVLPETVKKYLTCPHFLLAENLP